MANLRETPVLRAGPVETIAAVIARLGEIRDATAAAAPGCGITEFSDLYLTITAGIDAKIRSGTFFADGEYLGRLDVHFANRYLDALRAWSSGTAPPPEVWRLLFDAPEGKLSRVQLAAGGVNAHINLDLAVAVVDTARDQGREDLDAGTQYADYVKVNDVFAEEMDGLLWRMFEERSAAGAPAEDVSWVGRLATAVVAVARRHAWEDAESLWPLPRSSPEWNARERRMDEWAAWWDRGLLVDTST